MTQVVVCRVSRKVWFNAFTTIGSYNLWRQVMIAHVKKYNKSHAMKLLMLGKDLECRWGKGKNRLTVELYYEATG